MYKLISKLAFRSIFIRPSRTIMLIVMIAVSMSMMISLQGLYDGMTEQMVDSTKRSDSGELALFNKAYRNDKGIQHLIKDATKIQKELLTYPDVSHVVLRISVDGLVSTAKKSSFCSLRGIDLKQEESFGQFSNFLRKGEISFKKRGAFVSSLLAKDLKIKIGSKIVVSTQDKNGDINGISLRVRAIISTNNISLDGNTIYVDKKRLQKFLTIDENSATQIAVNVSSSESIKKIKQEYKEYDVKTFLELYPMLKMMQEVMIIFNSVTFFIVMMVVFIGILGVMYVSILDRIREFGILRSIGMAYKNIRTQIIFEALFIGLLGYIIGAVFGLMGLSYLHEVGLNLSAYADSMDAFGYPAILHATIKYEYFTSTFTAIVLSSIISVFLPLRKIKNLNPIDVIKADT